MTYLCTKGYGDEKYGLDLWGTGQHNGVNGRDIILYDSLPNGDIDLGRPLTYIPTQDEIDAGVIPPSLSPSGENEFPNIEKLKANILHRSYIKMWLRNVNPVFDLKNVTISILSDTDPKGFVKLALTSPGSSLLLDFDYSNVTGGYGPSTFVNTPLLVSTSLAPMGIVSFWARRDVVVKYENQQAYKHGLSITGQTDFSGTPCYQYVDGTGLARVPVGGDAFTVEGSGTSFSTELSVGDIIIVNSQVRLVSEIISDIELKVADVFYYFDNSYSAFQLVNM